MTIIFTWQDLELTDVVRFIFLVLLSVRAYYQGLETIVFKRTQLRHLLVAKVANMFDKI